MRGWRYLTLEDRGKRSRFLGMDARWDESTVAITGEGAIRALAADWQVTKVTTTPCLQMEENETRTTDVKL